MSENRDIPAMPRKTGEQLNAEHEAKRGVTEQVVNAMFEDVPWDLLRSTLKDRGFVLLTAQKDAERNRAAQQAETLGRQYESRVVCSIDKALSVLAAVRILMGEWDHDCSDPGAVMALVDAASGKLHAAKREKIK